MPIYENPMSPRYWGMVFSLSGDHEEMQRAKHLVEKNPSTYEISPLWPNNEPAPSLQFYHVVGHPYAESIVAWVRSGEGMEPS